MRLTWISLAAFVLSAACQQPDLTWVGVKTYDVASTTIFIENLGVDDSVAVLSARTFNVARPVSNTGRGSADAHIAREQIVRWIFQFVAGQARWVPGSTAADTVFQADASVGPLAAGAVDTIRFGPIGPLECGLYEQILTADATGVVSEGDEGNNVARHFFFVPSNQQFNIAVNTIVDVLGHHAGPTHTHDFIVTPAGASSWVYGHFSFVATEQSRVETNPAPPVAAGPTPQVIQMIVTPTQHNVPGGFEPTVTGKVTVISRDGCVVKHQTARVYVQH